MNTQGSSNSATASFIPISAPAALILNVKGMHCANCVQAVEKQLLKQTGVISATVDLATEAATVACQTRVDGVMLAQALTAAGFPSQCQNAKAETINDTKAQTSVPWVLMGFFILIVVFNLCLNAQVLTVGLAYFYNPEWWKAHIWLVRGYSGLSLILLLWAYRITVPRRVRSLTASLPVLLGLQFLTIHLKTPIPLAIVHPLIGFTLFTVSTTLVHRVSRFLFPREEET